MGPGASYREIDVAYFVQSAPCLALSRPTSAIRILEEALRLRRECFSGLEAYPDVQVEPLAFFYATARSLGMLDPGSLEVMMSKLTWRGVVWGGWLALMRPSPDFADVLARASAARPDNLMWVQCARALLEQRSPPAPLGAVYALAAEVREAVGGMRIERVPLRSDPVDDDRRTIERERELVRAAYQSGGAERALQLLRDTRLHELTMPYARWYRLQRRGDRPI